MKEYGIIGKSLQHSFSPKFFNAKFEAEAIDARFYAFPLQDINELTDLLIQKKISGLCITIPYKESVIPFLDEMDISAQKIGAVNCIQMHKGQLKGYNTDIIGFKNSLKPLLQSQQKKALILGTGGASKAVHAGLEQLGIEYTIVSRNPKANELAYENLDQSHFQEHKLIINTTPLGTFPNIEDKPNIPYEFLGQEHFLYDLVYNPVVTSFLKAGITQGAQIKNGYEMLVLQAEENWKVWNE